MNTYLALLDEVSRHGSRQQNRTGVDTFMLPGATLKFDLAHGFPIVTTKRVAFRAVVGELLGFLRGCTNAAQFRALGCKVWDANANENAAWLASPHRAGVDDLGRIYGAQWRGWRGFESQCAAGIIVPVQIDQLARALTLIRDDPTNRRIIVTAWQPAELDRMALPPCHLLFQFLVEQGRGALHLTMYQRSCDLFLGVPFNISSYALLLALVAKATGLEPGTLTMFLADAHIYETHHTQVATQLTRVPRSLPRLVLPSAAAVRWGTVAPLTWLENIEPNEIFLEGYDPYDALPAPLAV